MQNTELRREIERIDLICDEKMAVKFRKLEEYYFVLRMQRGRLSASTAPHYSSSNQEVIERNTCIFTALTTMLRDSCSKQEYLHTQRVMSKLHIHLEACALLSLPVSRGHRTTGLGVEGSTFDNFLNAIYIFLAALCDNGENRDDVEKIQHHIMQILVGNLSNLTEKSMRHGSRKREQDANMGQVDLVQTHLEMESLYPEVLLQAILSQVLIPIDYLPNCPIE